MTSQPVPDSRPPATIDRSEKKTLLVRIGIAGVLILAMIGALALFEQQQKQSAPDAPESRKSPTAAHSPATTGTQNQAGGPIAAPSGEPPTAPPTKPDVPAEPERSGPPQVAEPAATGKAGVAKPAIEKAVSAAEDTHPRLIVGRGSEPPPAAKSPAPQSPPARPATLESPPLARPASGFLVQVGVFSNLGNAEELRKKLADAGIPAQIEARVHVGPFATQAEAAAAQQKLKSIGMEPGMVLPARR